MKKPKSKPDITEVGASLLNMPEVRNMLRGEYGGMAAVGLMLIILAYLPPEKRKITLLRVECLMKAVGK